MASFLVGHRGGIGAGQRLGNDPRGLRFGVGYRCYLKLGARYYNPTTARFTQPDPSGQEPNTYNYASCNPINNTDPTGLFPCQGFNECASGGALVGGFIGAIGGGLVGAFATGGIGLFPGMALGGGEGASLGIVIGGTIGIGQQVVAYFS
jgi:RHS repeat-associated protein